MKRTYSKATWYRKIKKGTAACLDLSQDCCFDNENVLSPSNISNETVFNAIAENVEDLEHNDNNDNKDNNDNNDNIDNSDKNDKSHSSINLDYFDDMYDSSNQFDNSNDDINCNIPIDLEHNVIKDTDDTFSNRLQSWAVSYKIPHNALGSLLKLLQSIPNINLPKDPRTLLSTPRHIFSKSVAPGIYSHIGIKNAVKNLINFLDNKPERINLLINIDGLPISKSSNSQIYPILCSLAEYPQYVSAIGIYHGYEKPNNANDFLSDFVIEATELSQQGFTLNNHNIPFLIKAFICDAPAKSFITYCKGHIGFFSCTKCMQKGKYVKGRVCFPKINCQKRSNENFRNKVQPEHHLGKSILENIPSVNMVSSFPLEYMHLVCLGVVKKLILNLWLFGPAVHKLTKTHVEEISDYLIQIKSCIPSDFVRKPRSLNECKRWKATEFRFFLLYCGPVILKNILPFNKYLHFLSLHAAIRILISVEFYTKYLDYADSLLQYFIKQFIIIYGEEYISHNVHGLSHIVDDSRVFGNLDCYSAFSFENYLQYLKKLIRKPDAPLAQIINRIQESQNILVTQPQEKIQLRAEQKHYAGPLLAGNFCAQYKKLIINNISISIRFGDNCCYLKDKSIILIENFAQQDNNYYAIGRKYINKTDFIEEPFKSSIFDIYVVHNLSELLMWSVKDIVNKFVILPYNDVHVVLPLIHTFC